MRNIFDQYTHAENRLTHALATCLHESPRLLSSFSMLCGHPLPAKANCIVRTQYRPGCTNVSEEDAEKQHIPDIWLDDAEDWALVIEAKVEHEIRIEQLKGHQRAAREFANARVILISVRLASKQVQSAFRCLQWTDVYLWAMDQASQGDVWSRRLVDYLETLERKLPEERKLSGTLTTFTGIRFNAENPYSYFEAKRLLRLLMQAVRSNPELSTAFGKRVAQEGRSAITGSAGYAVWDMLPLTSGTEHFTLAPHLTVGIRHSEVVAQLTIPNNIPQPKRRRLIGNDAAEYQGLLKAFIQNLDGVSKLDPDHQPYVELVQRHWPQRHAKSVQDAELVFDPRTADGDGMVKQQSEWVQLSHAALMNKQSNLQLAIGVRFPYGQSKRVATPQLVDAVVGAFLATNVFVKRWDT